MIKSITKNTLLACLFLLVSVSPSQAVVPNQNANASHINASELKKMLDDGADLLLVDARNEELYKDGHIPGAVNIPADKVNSESLAVYAEDMNKKLVFYCSDTSNPSGRIGAAKAIGAGYKYVYELYGGYSEWKKNGYNVTKAQLKGKI